MTFYSVLYLTIFIHVSVCDLGCYDIVIYIVLVILNTFSFLISKTHKTNYSQMKYDNSTVLLSMGRFNKIVTYYMGRMIF